MKKIIFSVLMSVLLISPMEKVTAQMNSMAFYQKPTQSWSEYLKERKDDIIRTAAIKCFEASSEFLIILNLFYKYSITRKIISQIKM